MGRGMSLVICLALLVKIMKKTIYILLFSVLLMSCSDRTDTNDVCSLQPQEDYLEFAIDDETRIPLFNLYTFQCDGIDYLTFSTQGTRTILIYELQTGKLIKKIAYEAEGPNSVGTDIWGFYVKDFNHIYIPNNDRSIIYETDTTGTINRVIDYTKTVDGKLTLPAYYVNLNNQQMSFIGDSLFIPQKMSNYLDAESYCPTSVIVNMKDGKVSPFKMRFPQWAIDRNNDKTIEIPSSYSMVYDGKKFVYSFTMHENIFRVNPYTAQMEEFSARSRYLPKLKYTKMPDEFSQVLKITCETPEYGNILYDKYRKVYYRFTHLKSDLDHEVEHIKILHSGKMEFSIMILDEDFNILGETKFPSYTYLNNICFINEKGLYISTSHFMRKDYSDDVLRFQLFKLIDIN